MSLPGDYSPHDTEVYITEEGAASAKEALWNQALQAQGTLTGIPLGGVEYAERETRQRALVTALEMVKGTPQATDLNVIVKTARAFLAFIREG